MSYDLSKITYGGRCEKHLRFRPCEICARDAALRHQTVEVRPLDEAAVRRIVREELARSAQTAPGGPAGALRPDEQSRSGPSDRSLNPQPEAVDHDRGRP